MLIGESGHRNNRIAFVYQPYHPHTGRLETMPFALETVQALVSAGWNIDLFLWEVPSPNYQVLLPERVKIHYQEAHESLLGRRWQRIGRKLLSKFATSDYDCIFGVSQKGIVSAAALNDRTRPVPLVYLNEEYPSGWPKGRWAFLEKAAMQQVSAIVVPDSARIATAARELGVEGQKPFSVLPNAPTALAIENIDWHARLGLPPGSVPILHAGSVSDWAQIPEILSTVAYWPKETVLVVQSRVEKDLSQYDHLSLPGRVFWNRKPLSAGELNSLVAYSAITLALYRNTGPNLFEVGFSSGKLMRSLVCGTPVIASDFPSLAFVDREALGKQVNHPSEIPEAVVAILADLTDYRSRCLKFASNEGSFRRHWKEFCRQFAEWTGVRLAAALPSSRAAEAE